MSQRNKTEIGALSSGFIEDFFNYWNGDVMVLWFWFCLYDEVEIANRFEFSSTILKKRAAEMKWLNKMANDTGYTVNYFISMIKTTLPKLYPNNLKTYEDFKANVEAGLFTGCTNARVLDAIKHFNSVYFSYRFLDFTSIDCDGGCPDFQVDFKPIIPDVPYVTPVVEPVVTPETTNTNNSTASFSSTGILLALGGALLIGLFSKK